MVRWEQNRSSHIYCIYYIFLSFDRLWHQLTLKLTDFVQDPYFSKGDGLIQVWYQIRISSTLQKCNLKHFKSLFSFHSSMKTSSVILNTGKRQFWWDLLMDLITGINKPVDNFSTAIHWSCTHCNISGVTTAFKYVSDFSNQINLGELALKMWMIGWNDSLRQNTNGQFW